MVTEKRPMNHAGYISNLIRRGTTNKLYNKYIRAIKTQLIKEQHNLNINAIHGEKYTLFINKVYICFFFPFFIIIELKKYERSSTLLNVHVATGLSNRYFMILFILKNLIHLYTACLPILLKIRNRSWGPIINLWDSSSSVSDPINIFLYFVTLPNACG